MEEPTPVKPPVPTTSLTASTAGRWPEGVSIRLPAHPQPPTHREAPCRSHWEGHTNLGGCS